MNCEDMTDFEINKAVTMALGKFKASDYSKVSGNYHKGNVFDCNYSVGVVHDYCNNPSDVWPIIIKNKISIMNDGDLWEASIDFDGDLEKHGTDEVLTKHYEHANPLRAAMIVYLMMQEEL